jgi:hypothetical protein
LKCGRKKFGPIFKEYKTFYLKLSLSFQKYGFRIRKKPIQDTGVKKAPDPGFGTLHGQNLSSTSDCCAAMPASGAGRWGWGKKYFALG